MSPSFHSLCSLPSLASFLPISFFLMSLFLPAAGSRPANMPVPWTNSRAILPSCQLDILGRKCCLWFCKTDGKLEGGKWTSVAQVYSSCVLALPSCIGEVLGLNCRILWSWTAREVGKSVGSTGTWSTPLAGVIPGLHALAGHLPSGGESETASTSPSEGPVGALPGASCGWTFLHIHQVCCCKKGVSWASREGLHGRVSLA